MAEKKKNLLFRLGTLALSLCMALTSASLTATAEGETGKVTECAESDCTGTYVNGFCTKDGTHYQEPTLDGEVYQIANGGELYWFAALVNSAEPYSVTPRNAKLTADITVNRNVLSDAGTLNSGDFRAWTPIGNGNVAYRGTFDGDGHTISGLYCDNSEYTYVGLFGDVSGGTIQNLTLKDSFFRTSHSNDCYIGAIAAYVRQGTDEEGNTWNALVANCTSYATISTFENQDDGDSYAYVYVGGIVGETGSTLQDCINYGSVTVTGATFCVYVGGIAGDAYGGTVESCTNYGSVTVTGESEIINAGGIAGWAYSAIKTCTNHGSVGVAAGATQSMYVGGVVGYNNSATAESCVNTGTLVVISEDSKCSYCCIGGVIGENGDNSKVTNCANSGTVVAEGISGLWVGGITGYNDNAKVERSRNTGAVSAKGEGKSSVTAGGVIGYDYGEVVNCYNTGAVSAVNRGNGDYSASYAGGMVGFGHANTIKSCYNIGTVSAESEIDSTYAGGVAGSTTGEVSDCYYLDTAAKSAFGDEEQSASLAKNKEAFASGEVTYLLNYNLKTKFWKQNLDGIAKSDFPSFYGCTVCYSNDKYENDECKHSYEIGFCTDCGQACRHEGGLGEYDDCPTCGLKQANSTVARREDGVYLIYNAAQLLQFAYENSDSRGYSLDSAKLMADIVVQPFVLNEDGSLNQNIVDTEGVRTWTPIAPYEKGYRGTFDGNGFSISGLYCVVTSGDNRTAGLFGTIYDGTVKNLTIKNSYFSVTAAENGRSAHVGAIVGYLDEGTIENCKSYAMVECGSAVSDENSNQGYSNYLGGIVGWSSSTVKDCVNYGKVNGTAVSDNKSYFCVGGIVGLLSGKAQKCTNYGVVSASGGTGDSVGGVVGKLNSGTIDACVNSGSVSGGAGATAGGVVGVSASDTELKNSQNRGTVKAVGAKSIAGGVIGYAVGYSESLTAKVTNCTNSGTVSGEAGATVGGVAGKVMQYAFVERGTNLGALSAKADGGETTFLSVGGVVGELDGGTVKISYNVGKITVSANATVNCGGVVGASSASAVIENCYNQADVDATDTGTDNEFRIGGVVGSTDSGKVSNCYNIGMLGDQYAPVCGANHQDGATFTACYDLVADTDDETDFGKHAEKFASGKITYLLGSEGSVWRQTLDKSGDAYPNFTGKIVYTDLPYSDTYSNVKPKSAIDVTISWTSMEFTYTPKDWNASTHSYKDSEWNGTGGKITVENNGRESLKITPTFAATDGKNITGTFTPGNGTFDCVPVDTSADVTLTLGGVLDTPSDAKGDIGTVTIVVSTVK